MSNTLKDTINIGDQVRIENRGFLRGRKGFEDFEGKVESIFAHVFGFSGTVRNENGSKVFDTEVHKILKV